MLDFSFLYVYGILIALAMPVGEWLDQNVGFSQHVFSMVFWALSGMMFARGLYSSFLTPSGRNSNRLPHDFGEKSSIVIMSLEEIT